MTSLGPSGKDERYLTGQLLIAMPNMSDPRFARAVIYICDHNAQGALGLVINRLAGTVSFEDLLEQLGIEAGRLDQDIRVHYGGPVESGRGLVLHSTDYRQEGTLQIDESIGLTQTISILRDIAKGSGPGSRILALGYAGWGPGQLDAEIQANGWLHVEADLDLVFDDDLESKWERAIAKLGVDVSMLSGDAGHA